VPSLLRLAGAGLGLAVLLLALLHRRRGASRALFGLELLGTIGLLLVAAFPDQVGGLQAFFGISDQPLSRLVTLLIITTAILFGFVLYALNRAERASARVSRLIYSLSAAQVEHDSAHGRLGGVLVCIPAYNEEESLPGVLSEIPPAIDGVPTHVLVIDDASSDRTAHVARSLGARVITQPVNGGQGAALQTGYLVAERLGVDVVVTLDADGQHNPGELGRLVRPILGDRADFVAGSRRLGSYEMEEGAGGRARDVGVWVFSRLLNTLGGTSLTDVSNGFRAVRADRLPEIALTEDQFHNPELLIGAAHNGLRIMEVPVTIRRRQAGRSKKGGTLRYGFGFLRVLVRSWLRETPRVTREVRSPNGEGTVPTDAADSRYP
jgi:hypothetical protein